MAADIELNKIKVLFIIWGAKIAIIVCMCITGGIRDGVRELFRKGPVSRLPGRVKVVSVKLGF